MKKLLLSAAFLGLMFQVNAQKVGIGAFDDFNQEEPYAAETGGIFWWGDKDTTYALTRTGTTLQVAVNKGTGYDPIGFGFGDTAGDGTGTPYTLDISGTKMLKLMVSATGGTELSPIKIDIQLEDADSTKLELDETNADWGGANKLTINATDEVQEFVFDLTNARIVKNWDCTPFEGTEDETDPATCPTIDEESVFDFDRVTKVSFFVTGGAVYNGTVVIEDVKLGTLPTEPGLNTAGVLGLAASNVSEAKLFPNPATTEANVKLSLKNASEVSIVISDMLGREVKSINAGTVTSYSSAINVSDLNKGTYTVSYMVNGASAKTELLLVK